jgi:Ca2+/Na+ antiporter
MSLISTNSYTNIRNSVGKMYLSIIMAIFMVIFEVFMHDMSYHTIHSHYYVILASLFVIFIVLYRRQIGINDKQYLNEMIEHHSMAILTSEEILQKTNSERVKKLAQNIITTQEKEINYMKELIKNINSN